MNRQRRIYVGLLGLGVAALATDRLVLKPAGAVAAPESGTPAAETAELTPAAPPSHAPVRPNLADRLSVIPWSAPGRDGFKADESWVLPPKPEAAAAANEPAAFSIQDWETRNPLRSIYALGRDAGADDAPAPPLAEPTREFRARFGEQDVAPGDSVDGCRVLSIEATTVWIEHEARCYAVDILHPRRPDNGDPRRGPAVIVKQNPEAPAPGAAER
jgi:hypothetical protein